MNKLKDFTRKYGFYLAVGLVSVSAVGAAIFLSSDVTQVDSENGAYVGSPLEEVEDGLQDAADTLQDALTNDASTDEGIIESVDLEASSTDVEEIISDEASIPTSEVVEDEIVAETFSSTTADPNEAPFFAEGDSLLWPVDGELIVPFRDDSTKHWYSTALEQTMRTYGVCISAKEGEAIKAPAKGVIVDIIDDATTMDSMKLIGNVGHVIVIDHGNGYTTELGIQGGIADKDLLGQTVDAKQAIGTVGKATGPFADLGYNVYLQVKHEDKIVDPTTILGYHESVAGVDMGHVAD